MPALVFDYVCRSSVHITMMRLSVVGIGYGFEEESLLACDFAFSC